MGRYYTANGKQYYGEHISRVVAAQGAWAAGAVLPDIALDRDFLITNIRLTATMTALLTATAAIDGPKRSLQTLQVVGDSKTFFSLTGGVVISQLGRLLAFLNKFDNQAASLGAYVDVGAAGIIQNYNVHPGHFPKNRFDLSVCIPARALSNLVARVGCSANTAIDPAGLITPGVYTFEIDGVSGVPVTRDMFYPGSYATVVPHVAITGAFGSVQNIPTGGYVRRVVMMHDDATAVNALRTDAQVTAYRVTISKDSTELITHNIQGLKYANALRYGMVGDEQPVALGAVAGTRTGYDGSTALPVGVAIIDFRDYFDPVLGLNMVNAQEGDARLGFTIAVAAGQTALWWDIVYPMDPIWVGK